MNSADSQPTSVERGIRMLIAVALMLNLLVIFSAARSCVRHEPEPQTTVTHTHP